MSDYPMNDCIKCHGLVVVDELSFSPLGRCRIQFVRCVNCGLVLDEVMMYNKSKEAIKIRSQEDPRRVKRNGYPTKRG